MQYLYHREAGYLNLQLKDEKWRYLFKVRRHRKGDVVALRNLIDNNIYFYKIVLLSRKVAELTLQNSRELIIEAKRRLHIGWCIIEPKNIERTLPTLNEIGVNLITFIYCQRSQRNFRLDFKRLNKILINSSQQSGRGRLMGLEIANTLQEFLTKYPNAHGIHFSNNILDTNLNIKTIVVGCEGGFTDNELKLFHNIVGLNTSLILKSETAVTVSASKILI